MLCRNGKLSLFCFLQTVIISLLPVILRRLKLDVYSEYFPDLWSVLILFYILLNSITILIYHGLDYEIAVRSIFLGFAFGVGLIIATVSSSSWKMFGVYACLLSTFHYSEFLTIAYTNPKSLSVDSFILNHSVAYGVAACSSWLEFMLERYFFPDLKIASFIAYIGIALCISGEILRKLAMLTAKQNFNHIVQSEKKENHELVTFGVYKLCRHPSYVGWFYWSIGTQMVLQNPICFIAYALASWKFFRDRVFVEEITLINFFGEDYIEYQKKVGTGLPFIKGCLLKL